MWDDAEKCEHIAVTGWKQMADDGGVGWGKGDAGKKF
jgi:hypothetical protein